jgi:hypothetical protein
VGLAGRLRRRRRAAVVAPIAACLVLAGAAARGSDDPQAVRDGQRWRRDLDQELGRALRLAGGRPAVLRCGRPYVGRYRGTLLAYRLEVPKRTVGLRPRSPGVVFRSRLNPGHAVRPGRPPGFRRLARTARWELVGRCTEHRRLAGQSVN